MRIAVAGGTGVLGRYIVAAVENAGQETVTMSRSTGVDVASGAGLAAALDRVDAVVDASNTQTQGRRSATAFFRTVSGNLQRFGAEAGVRRIVTISIVGIDRVPRFPYYAAKLAQEAAIRGGPLPVSVLRATQFHEFPVQVLRRLHLGRIGLMPDFRVQTVAARAAGAVAAELALDPSPPDMVEVAGPDVSNLLDLGREVARNLDVPVRTVLRLPVPGRSGRAMRSGALTIADSPGARVVGPTFSDWLSGGDARAV